MSHLIYRQFQIDFEIASGNITGQQVFEKLGGFINTDLVESQVDDTNAHVWFTSTEEPEQIIDYCSDLAKMLDESFDARLIYKILSVDL